MKTLCVFCGSGKGRTPSVYVDAARETGQALAKRGIGLVYGGGRIGLMGVVADAVLLAGGTVIGVIPEALASLELAHQGLTDLRVVQSMHERKAMMADLAEGFLALPGGYGTLEEFCEVVTWAQLGLHDRPCGLLNVRGYYDPLLALFDRAVEEEFVPPVHRSLVLDGTEIDELLDRLDSYAAPPLFDWLTREES